MGPTALPTEKDVKTAAAPPRFYTLVTFFFFMSARPGRPALTPHSIPAHRGVRAGRPSGPDGPRAHVQSCALQTLAELPQN